MPVAPDILESYRRPKAVMARKLADGVREDRALATVMGASLINFVAQWPAMARAAHFDPATPLDARLGGALLATVFMLPLFAYLLAAVSQLVMRLTGRPISGFAARMALFWAMLANAPLLLLNGLVAGFLGAGPAQWTVGTLTLAGFLYLWIMNLRAASV